MEATDALTTIFSHNLWANLRLLDTCAELGDEQLATAVSGTYGAIDVTLRHLVRAEQSYLTRISTGLPHQWPKDAPPMTLAEMKHSVQATGAGLIQWAAQVRAGDTVTVQWSDDATRDVPKVIILNQAINHATEHRSQIMTIMTQLGVQPPDLDSWTYFEELSEVAQ